MRRAASEPLRVAGGRPAADVPAPPPHGSPHPTAHPTATPLLDTPTAPRCGKNMGVSSLTRNASALVENGAQTVRAQPLRVPFAPRPPVHPHHAQQALHPPAQHNHAQQLELQRLRAQVEERDKEIAALRQAAKLKDRKLDQLSNRCRKEQMRQYYRFMELEPVVEMEEDVSEESSSSSSGPPSLSPPPFGSDYWSEQDSLYAGLAREHAELQRSHHALELRLKRSEARARAANERLQALQAEAQELRELNELQEFRILELEGAGEHSAPARSPGPDTRDVCTDTDNDDVSDSGVLSLPASEDDLGVHDLKLEQLAPVPDLKDKLLEAARALVNVEHKWTLHQAAALLDDARLALSHAASAAAASAAANHNNMNHTMKSLPDFALSGDPSKFPSRIIATVPPFNEMLQPNQSDAKASAKQLTPNKIVSTLAANFCLRCTEELCSQGTQTDGGVGSPQHVPSHGDLRAEIQKLNQFRERVEERGGDLAFCRERLSALEEKVRLYEKNSGGSAQDAALWQQQKKEMEAQVKKLEEQIARLQAANARLEEQRCELEEAENDTRLRCQKLEMKLQLMSEESRDLQSKLLQERRVSANLKSSLKDGEKLQREVCYLQSMLSAYEERNFELEERETDSKHQLEGLLTWWPAVLAWNMLQVARAFPKHPPTPLPLEYKPLGDPCSNGLCRSSQERLVQRMRELERELQRGVGPVSDSDKTDRQTMTDEQLARASPAKVQQHEECCRQLRHALQAEAQLKHKVRDLERKEKAYMETLQEADDLWSELEGGYQKQVEALRASEADLRARLQAMDGVNRMPCGGGCSLGRSNAETAAAEEAAEAAEAAAEEAAAMARKAEEERAAAAAKAAQLSEALAAADGACERAQHEADALRQRLAQERRLCADLRQELQGRGDAMDSMQEAFEKDIDKLKSQISMLESDNLQLSKECEELKYGIEKLQIVVKEQQELLVEEKDRSEEALTRLSNEIAEKERELQRILSMTRDDDVRSAQEELEEAEAQNHKSTDIESDDETSPPQYSTFPRSAREKTVLPPIKPPRRVKKLDVKKAKESMTNKSYSLELIDRPQGNLEKGFKGRNRSLQDVSGDGVISDYFLNSQERNERAPTPIPNPKREANSTKKAFIAYLPSAEATKCQTPSDNSCKPTIRGWRSQSESHRKPRWLTELSVRVNESSRNRPLSFPIKRSILYWDNINPKLQLKFSS